MEGVVLSLSLSLLSLMGLPSHSNSLYRQIIRSLCQRIAPYIAALSDRVLYLGVLAHVAVGENK